MKKCFMEPNSPSSNVDAMLARAAPFYVREAIEKALSGIMRVRIAGKCESWMGRVC